MIAIKIILKYIKKELYKALYFDFILLNSINSGYISNLPKNMPAVIASLDRFENPPKEEIPNAIPLSANVVNAVFIIVSKLNPS